VLLAAAAFVATPQRADAGVLEPADSLLRAGPVDRDPFGTTVAGLGDVNGDGLGDAAILHSVPGADGRPGPAAVVVFGSRDRVTADAAAPGTSGFVVDHAPDAFPDDDVRGLRIAQGVGMSVAPAGDVNADGLADVVLGAASLGNSLRRRSGSAFVVFGKRDAEPVRLDALGDGGFRVDGPKGGSGLGYLVAGLGDVNGDGRGDVAVGSTGAAYVVFGKADGGLVDLRSPGDAAYAMRYPADEAEDEDYNFHSVAAAGDANGDGRADVIVSTAESGRDEDGLWVVFGKPDAAPVDLRALGPGGYQIADSGAHGGDPYVADGVGDVNGDGRGDVVVDAEEAAWVVYGRPEPGRVVPPEGGRGVLALRGESGVIAGVGDVNGDGLGDLAFGLPGRDGSCRTDAGGIAVVYGRAGGGAMQTRPLAARDGFELLGDESGANLGSALDGAGDVNGDGRPDLALDVRIGERRELRVVTAADTGRPPPERGTCVILRALDRSLRRVLRARRVRLRLTVKEPGEFLLSPEVGKCGPRECWLDPNPDFTGRVVRFDAPGTKTVTIPIGPKTVRELRRRHVTDLTICASDEGPCVELEKRARRRARR
jgi:FG-GAP-like repeat